MQTKASINRLKGTTSVAPPIDIGRSTQVWHIELTNDADEQSCVARITMAVLTPKLAQT